MWALGKNLWDCEILKSLKSLRYKNLWNLWKGAPPISDCEFWEQGLQSCGGAEGASGNDEDDYDDHDHAEDDVGHGHKGRVYFFKNANVLNF